MGKERALLTLDPLFGLIALDPGSPVVLSTGLRSGSLAFVTGTPGD
jgi:hypothetical protein